MSDQEPVSVTFTLSESEVRDIARALFARRRRRWLAPILCGVFFVAGFLFLQSGLLVYAVAAFIWWFTCTKILGPRLLWKRCERGLQQYTFTVEDVSARLPKAEARYDWDYWDDVLRAGDSYVLKSVRGLVLVPRRAFDGPDAEERFVALAQSRWNEGSIRF